MAKSSSRNSNTTGAAKGKRGTGMSPASRAEDAKMRTATAKRRSDRTSPASPGARTSAREQRAGAEGGASQTSTAKAKPAARTRTAANPRTTTRAAAKRTTQRTRQEEGASSLRPIRQRQSRDQILATIATDSGVERPIVERVARSLSQTLTRHLMRNGSGRVDIPYLGAALWRGREGARPARKMASPILKGRIVEIPARRAMAVARIRVHSALREIVART